MTSQRTPFKQAEILVDHHALSEPGHYVPHKARDPQVIAERKRLLPGTLRARNQAFGIEMAGIILDHTTSVEGRTFAANFIAISGINTAAYLGMDFTDVDRVRRRNHKAPVLAEDDWRQTTAGLKTLTVANFGTAAAEANKLTRSIEAGKPSKRFTNSTRRSVASASFGAAILREETIPHLGNEFETQDWSRETVYTAIHEARDIGKQLGSVLSLMQFADERSPIYTVWEDAPDDAYSALEIARDQLMARSEASL